jgi:hypothetical protein
VADLPPLWIDKCLYTPTLVVRAVIEAAVLCCSRLAGAAAGPRRRRAPAPAADVA